MKNYKIFIIPTCIVVIILILMLPIINWRLYSKLTTANNHIHKLEYNFNQLQKKWIEDIEAIHSQTQNNQEKWQQRFNELANIAGSIESTEPGYQIRGTLRLLTLAATQLALNKGEPLAKDLLNQAINKLIKINDPRLSPTLYNIQDQYDYLLNDYNNKNTHEVLQTITKIQELLEKLQKSEIPAIEMNDLFSDPQTNKNFDKISFFKLEMLNIYLEQAKLSFLQNNDFLYKQTLAAINKTLKLILWSPEVVLEIQEHLAFLETVDIKNYSLLLQAILNLEDLL